MYRYKSKPLFHPLSCWDIASQSIFRKRNFFDLIQFKKLVTKYNWNLNYHEIATKDFQAIVVTDLEEQIIWTSRGFSSLTGYSSKFAIGKKPSFLQGRNSDGLMKEKIKKAIQQRESVSATIINYRKDGSEYYCHIEIKPLYSNQKLKNFVAIEREVHF